MKIWGEADAGEELTLNFNNKDYKSTATKQAKWEIILNPLSVGGPYIMTI